MAAANPTPFPTDTGQAPEFPSLPPGKQPQPNRTPVLIGFPVSLQGRPQHLMGGPWRSGPGPPRARASSGRGTILPFAVLAG